MPQDEVKNELTQLIEKIVEVCNGHAYSIVKAALVLSRDHICQQECLELWKNGSTTTVSPSEDNPNGPQS